MCYTYTTWFLEWKSMGRSTVGPGLQEALGRVIENPEGYWREFFSARGLGRGAQLPEHEGQWWSLLLGPFEGQANPFLGRVWAHVS